MIETSHAALYALWQKVAQRNQWILVDDEAAFLEHVAAEFEKLSDVKPLRRRQEMAIERVYSVLLYNGVQQRQDRAFYELGLAFVRIAVKEGEAVEDAQDIAHTTIQIILENMSANAIRKPPGFLSFSLATCRNVLRKRWRRSKKEQPFPTNPQGETTFVPVDPHESTVDVERQVIARQVLALLRVAVRNDRELQVIWKTIVDEDSTHEVAQDLDIPEHTVRNIKHRARKQLKKNEELRTHLLKLAQLRDGDSGVHDEEQ